MQKCNCNNKDCKTCKDLYAIEIAMLLKQDLLNGYVQGNATKAQVDAYINATCTVLDILTKKAA